MGKGDPGCKRQTGVAQRAPETGAPVDLTCIVPNFAFLKLFARPLLHHIHKAAPALVEKSPSQGCGLNACGRCDPQSLRHRSSGRAPPRAGRAPASRLCAAAEAARNVQARRPDPQELPRYNRRGRRHPRCSARRPERRTASWDASPNRTTRPTRQSGSGSRS